MSDDIKDTDVDVDFEPEDELGSIGALKTKLAKLKEELETVRKERAEYLDGWQRCKADSINARKDALEALEATKLRSQESILESILPVLDSFDMAMRGDAWKTVDPAWRSGVEGIRSQLESVLQEYSVESFGNIGDAFDPLLHEPIQEEQGGNAHTIARVFRRGYKSKTRVIRPAQVAVFSE